MSFLSSVGHAVSHAAHAVGHAASSGAHAVGHATGSVARTVGHAAGATAREAAEWGRTAGHVAQSVVGTLTNNHRTGNDPVARNARADAMMSNDVYADKSNPADLPPGVRVATPAELARVDVTPAMLDSGNFRARVYVTGSGADTHYTVAFRGTRMEKAADWETNAKQALGQQTEHYQKALAIGRSLANHPELSVSMTGHSLGGGLASAAAIAAGRDANTFNAAGLSDNTIRTARAINAAGDNHREARVEAFYVRGEVLSALQDGGDRVAGALLGGAFGAAFLNAPEAYGHRHAIGNDRPPGNSWSEELPLYRALVRHKMEYVLHNLPH